METRLNYVNVLVVAVAVFSCLCLVERVEVEGASYPKSQADHMQQRDDLIQKEKEFESRNFKLTEDEIVVDQFLAFLKWKEAQITMASGFPPSKPIEKVLDEVQKTELYKILKELPKGGNLHSHEDHQLSKRLLFDIIWSSSDFGNLYIITNTSHPDVWMMDFFVNPPEGQSWETVRDAGLTKETILKKNTLLNLLTPEATNNPTDASKRWALINPLWGRASVQLISNINIKREYLKAMYEHSMSEGVTYLETRRSLGWEMPLYELDRTGASNGTNGKKFLDPNYELEVTLAVNLTKEFTKRNSRFIGHKRISYAVRFMDNKTFDQVMSTTVRLNRKFPDHVLGFDAVGEEDAGYSSLHYLDNYLSLYADGKSAVPLFLHSVETSWPDDILTGGFEGDLLPTLQNGYESVLLQAKRVGHGKGFIKKPYLRQMLKERKTAVEVCIVSNQILGMDADIRNHYGQTLYKEGVPVVLAPDDPGTFGYDNVTVDWYMAYLGWGLNLGDLKQLARNSLTYSGMSESERSDAIDNKWTPSWSEFISRIKDTACKRDFIGEATNESRRVVFHRVLPTAAASGSKVHIFGRNFEPAICKPAKCKFADSLEASVIYESNQHISCVVPVCDQCRNATSIQVALDGKTYSSTGVPFQFLPSTGHSTRKDSHLVLSLLLIALRYILLI